MTKSTLDAMGVDALKSLSVGDTLLTKGVFGGVTDEKCYWVVTHIQKSKMVFEVQYFEAAIARFIVTLKGKKAEWEELK